MSASDDEEVPIDDTGADTDTESMADGDDVGDAGDAGDDIGEAGEVGDAGEAGDDGAVSTWSPGDTQYSRDIIVVPDGERMTSSSLSLYELTELISIRSGQIAKYANCLVDTAGLSDPRDQAVREFNARKTPLVLERRVGERAGADGKLHQYVELWRPAEMTCIHELN